MNLRIVTAATAEPITLAQAKLHLRIAADDDPIDSPPAVGPEDSVIEGLIAAAREHAEGFLARALTDAVYELRFGAFERFELTGWHTPIWAPDWVQPWFFGQPVQCGIALPLAPVQAIESIVYVDSDGVEQTLGTAVYKLDDDPDDPMLRLAYGAAWPTIRYEPNAVRVRFQGGYVDPNPVPRPIIQAMLLMIGEWYENRENSIIERGAVLEIPFGAMTLLRPYRRLMGV